jgi:YYY domain-containing protein
MLGILIYLISGIIISQTIRQEYYISRFLSILLICLISFILSFIFPFKVVFYLTFATFLGYGFWSMHKNGINFDYISEGVFTTSFLFFLFLRSLSPSAFGAEKLMDVAFLNSVLTAERFPPPDPFFAGGDLSFYYYFGYVVGSAITLMSLSTLEVGYNIAIASVPAFFIMLGQGVLRELLKDSKHSNTGIVLGTAFITISSNPYSAYEFFSDIFQLRTPGYLYYWNASRVISDLKYDNAITEFPYFSFIHADFHAHVVALPIKLLAIALLYRYFKKGESTRYLAVISFILFAVNSWDIVFMLAIVLVSIYRFYSRRDVNELKRGFLIVISALIPSMILYTFMSSSAGLHFTSERTDVFEFLLHFGFIFLFVYLYLLDEVLNYRISVPAMILGGVAYFVAPVLLLTTPLLILSIKKYTKGDFYSTLMITSAILISACEFISIESRMNTIFKFYLIAWVLLSLPSAKFIAGSFKGRMKYLITTILVLSLIYPVVATPIRHYEAKFTLDSSIFIKERSKGDYDAIKFLKDKRSVIAESSEGCYTYGGRISAFTTNQALITWPCHEVLWRSNSEEIVDRMSALRVIYKSSDCKLKKEIAEKYKIKYIVFGDEERLKYSVKKFKCFRLIFKSGSTEVYDTGIE